METLERGRVLDRNGKGPRPVGGNPDLLGPPEAEAAGSAC